MFLKNSQSSFKILKRYLKKGKITVLSAFIFFTIGMSGVLKAQATTDTIAAQSQTQKTNTKSKQNSICNNVKDKIDLEIVISKKQTPAISVHSKPQLIAQSLPIEKTTILSEKSNSGGDFRVRNSDSNGRNKRKNKKETFGSVKLQEVCIYIYIYLYIYTVYRFRHIYRYVLFINLYMYVCVYLCCLYIYIFCIYRYLIHINLYLYLCRRKMK
jgi:hypothetical protein